VVRPIFIGRWVPKIQLSLKERPYRRGKLRRWERLPAHAHQKPPQSPIKGLAGGPFQGTLAAPCLHFMLVPDYTAGCPSCSASADGFNGIVVHLVNHDAMLWAVNRNRRDTWTGTTRETCSTTKDILE
jgi:hypothetical protein